MKDCCDDEGWLLKLHLSSCPEVEDLIQKKADGKCHYVGKYSEGDIFGEDEYKSYCCYTSKMARATEEGAETQIGKTFGKPKKPNCRGLTPDEFASLDFTKIDLNDAYGDMEQGMVAPDPNEMQSTPDNYYSTAGVNP
jgi:conjugal transfer mating pair stabilization protein TraN